MPSTNNKKKSHTASLGKERQQLLSVCHNPKQTDRTNNEMRVSLVALGVVNCSWITLGTSRCVKDIAPLKSFGLLTFPWKIECPFPGQTTFFSHYLDPVCSIFQLTSGWLVHLSRSGLTPVSDRGTISHPSANRCRLYQGSRKQRKKKKRIEDHLGRLQSCIVLITPAINVRVHTHTPVGPYSSDPL